MCLRDWMLFGCLLCVGAISIQLACWLLLAWKLRKWDSRDWSRLIDSINRTQSLLFTWARRADGSVIIDLVARSGFLINKQNRGDLASPKPLGTYGHARTVVLIPVDSGRWISIRTAYTDSSLNRIPWSKGAVESRQYSSTSYDSDGLASVECKSSTRKSLQYCLLSEKLVSNLLSPKNLQIKITRST